MALSLTEEGDWLGTFGPTDPKRAGNRRDREPTSRSGLAGDSGTCDGVSSARGWPGRKRPLTHLARSIAE